MKISQMKKSVRWLVLPASFAALGMSMPSCPGQQALQQQVETLSASNTDLTKKVQTLSTEFKTLTTDMNQVKQILPQMTTLMTTQKATIEQLESTVRDLQNKVKGSKKKK